LQLELIIMKLKNAEILALFLIAAVLIYSAATKNHKIEIPEKGNIQKRKLKEDSTVIIVDIPPAKAEDMFQYSYEHK
jgi:hypothetical protein